MIHELTGQEREKQRHGGENVRSQSKEPKIAWPALGS